MNGVVNVAGVKHDKSEENRLATATVVGPTNAVQSDNRG